MSENQGRETYSTWDSARSKFLKNSNDSFRMSSSTGEKGEREAINDIEKLFHDAVKFPISSKEINVKINALNLQVAKVELVDVAKSLKVREEMSKGKTSRGCCLSAKFTIDIKAESTSMFYCYLAPRVWVWFSLNRYNLTRKDALDFLTGESQFTNLVMMECFVLNGRTTCSPIKKMRWRV